MYLYLLGDSRPAGMSVILSFLSNEGFELDGDRISTFYQSLFNIESARI